MATWRIIRDEDETLTTEDGLFDIPEVTDTFNPFANVGIAEFDDRDGELYDEFPRGTRVDFEWTDGVTEAETLVIESGETHTVESGETQLYSEVIVEGDLLVDGTLEVGTRDYITRLEGFVVERREIEDGGADQLEIEVYSLDQLLRGGKVTENTEGLTIMEALETIVVNDTPVDWVADNVSVGDNITLTRDLSGENVEDAILYLSYLSNNEQPSVNEDREFEFAQVETEPAPRDIDDTQYFHCDVPEEGQEVINEVRVWFNDGEERLTVESGGDKLDLQDSLGLDDAFSTVKEVSRTEITDLDDAKAIGNQILEERATTTPIAVTTYGLEEAEPGQVINVEIPEKGLNDDFEIAAISYNWGGDETELILVENTGYQDELLGRVVDSVERVELEGINRDADDNRITDTRVEALIDVTGNINGTEFERTRFTNIGRNKVRDAWGGDDPIDITDVVIGDDDSGLSRTNEELGIETDSASASETLDGSKAVEYDASFGDTSAIEAGLVDADGDLIARGVLDSEESDTDLSVTVALEVSDNEDISRGVFTDDGQETVRDIIADNSPDLPTQYAYGQDGTDPDESGTALGDESIAVSLENIIITSADSTSEWETVL